MHKHHTVVLLSVLVIFLGLYAVLSNLPHPKDRGLELSAAAGVPDMTGVPL